MSVVGSSAPFPAVSKQQFGALVLGLMLLSSKLNGFQCQSLSRLQGWGQAMLGTQRKGEGGCLLGHLPQWLHPQMEPGL